MTAIAAVISVHCHNDLGLAVANSMAAIYAGAGQVECTVNGIGERAGNASLEEIVMGLRTRKDFYDAGTQIRTEEISKSSRLVSKITGMVVQPNKAIVGANAFAHTSGIHQDGLLKDKTRMKSCGPGFHRVDAKPPGDGETIRSPRVSGGIGEVGLYAHGRRSECRVRSIQTARGPEKGIVRGRFWNRLCPKPSPRCPNGIR